MQYARVSIAVGLLCFFSSTVQAAPPTVDLPTARAAAKDQNKRIFIYVFDSV